MDVRNHGQSEHSDQMDYDLMKDDIIRLMDELWLDSTILVGHSMGGKIAMTTALCQVGKQQRKEQKFHKTAGWKILCLLDVNKSKYMKNKGMETSMRYE